jgi:hypothetical protein
VGLLTLGLAAVLLTATFLLVVFLTGAFFFAAFVVFFDPLLVGLARFAGMSQCRPVLVFVRLVPM